MPGREVAGHDGDVHVRSARGARARTLPADPAAAPAKGATAPANGATDAPTNGSSAAPERPIALPASGPGDGPRNGTAGPAADAAAADAPDAAPDGRGDELADAAPEEPADELADAAPEVRADELPDAPPDPPDSGAPADDEPADELADPADGHSPAGATAASGAPAHLRDVAARLRDVDRALYAGKVAHDEDAVAALRGQRRHLLASAVTFAERVAHDGALADVPDVPVALALTPSLLASAAAAAARDILALRAEATEDDDADEPAAVGVPALQGSLQGDRLVLWAGAHGTPPAVGEELEELIREAGGDSLPLVEHPGVRIPGGAIATARSVDLASSLGWLVAVAAGHVGHDAGPSLGWLGRMAVFAVDLVARGQVVPTLEPVGQADGPSGLYTSRWQPVPGSEARRVGQLATRMPETVAATAMSRDRTVVTNTVLGTLVDAICRAGAARLSRQPPPVVARSLQTASEAYLSGLGNGPYRVEVPVARELAARLNEWARPALEGRGATLMVRLSAPDELGAWRLRVFVIDGAGHRLPLATARARGNPRQQRAVRAELDRLTHLVPALARGNAAEALLGNEEAWALMTETAPLLEGAGFVVQVPQIGRSSPSARLRLESAPSEGPSVVGAAQLTAVRWSAVIDDVELNAADIRRLAAQAKPLIESRGKWVALDHATLRELADALAERDRQKQMSQADILRQALGLEGGLAVEVEGEGWAADVLAKAADARAEPLPAPDGFRGELRTYQAAARGWLHFLDTVGLGGCLALDMGLGKTPTVLAHLLEHRGDGPALVIAPAAVVGNWATEARKFAPSLKVLIHHGASRASGEDVAGEVAGKDIVITTYNTATRDADSLATVSWARLVADEAQAIKNPVSEAARALMRIPAAHKLALTGTPVENGLGDLWSILNFANPGLLGPKATFEAQLARARKDQAAEEALRKMNGVLVFRRTKSEPEIAAELPDKIDQLDACALTTEQIGMYQAVVDSLLANPLGGGGEANTKILAAITALKQICDHPEAYVNTGGPLAGRSGKLQRLEELAESVFAAGERMLVFTHFATWGDRLATYLTERFEMPIACYHGGLTRTRRDEIVRRFQSGSGAGALVVSLKAGGTGLNLTAANHVVLYDRWWNPAVEDQARDRAWRIGQTKTVVSHRLVCAGTVDEQIEEVVAGKRRVADLVLPKSSTLADLGADQLRRVLGLRADAMVEAVDPGEEEPAA
ncbi:MAG TPA: DEAD/DEAH box helicase [Acidimicrobiales bacterium]|nr:DEAD/DEAH box helicase [Acidimicrobiales bacterium]